MNNDRETLRETDEKMQQGQTPTMQRPRTERGETGGSNEEIDDDAMIDESIRSDIGAGE